MWRNGPQIFWRFGAPAATPSTGQSPRASRYRWGYHVSTVYRLVVLTAGTLSWMRFS